MSSSQGGNGLSGLQVESVSAVTATPSVSLGERRFESGRKYIYVYNKSTQQISPGYAVVLSSSTGYSVTPSVDTTTMTELPFGIVNEATIPSNYYGWVVTEGFVQLSAGANTALSLNNAIILCGTSNTGNICRKTLHTVYSQINDPTAFGVVTQSGTTGGLAYGYVKCVG